MLSIISRILHPCHALAGLVRKYWRHFPNDEKYLKIVYFLEMGHKLNLDDPRTFTEKIQWLKLYDRRSEYIQMVDKISVKGYVSKILNKNIVIPTLGVWNTFEEIDFSLLPPKFVLKTNHGSGNNGVVICRDKNSFDKEKACIKLNKGLLGNTYNRYREWPYKYVKPKIFAEELLEENEGDGSLTDFKFYCFNGRAKYCQVIKNRLSLETIDFYDMEWNHQDFIGLNPKAIHSGNVVNKPAKLKEMIDYAEKLSANIPFVRIDFYHINDRVYFGEITFYPASGLGKFKPKRYDKLLGEMIIIPQMKTKK